MSDYFYWSERSQGKSYLTWIARPNQRSKFARFWVHREDDGSWTVDYAPYSPSLMKPIASGFASAFEAKKYAEMIWLLGGADSLWGRNAP